MGRRRGCVQNRHSGCLLLHEHSVDEIVAELRPGELEQVIKLVGRCTNCYPPGTFDGLGTPTRRSLIFEAPTSPTSAGSQCYVLAPLRALLSLSAPS
jgi:hypothetical protein